MLRRRILLEDQVPAGLSVCVLGERGSTDDRRLGGKRREGERSRGAAGESGKGGCPQPILVADTDLQL